jgi:hypothetical protein
VPPLAVALLTEPDLAFGGWLNARFLTLGVAPSVPMVTIHHPDQPTESEPDHEYHCNEYENT